MREIWKPIKGFGMYDNLYEASTFGNIKRTGIGSKPLKLSLLKCGYARITLCKNSHKKTRMMHRIIAKTFIENPENLEQVNHKDGNKINNCVANLEWCTGQQNFDHAKLNNLILCGEKNPRAILTEKDVNDIKLIRRLHYTTYKEIGARYNVSPSTIFCVCKGKSWSKVQALNKFGVIKEN